MAGAAFCQQAMVVRHAPLPGVLVIEPDIHRDARGFFLESYNRRRYAESGVPADFVQDNYSQSRRGVLRGLHFQDMSDPMDKLVRCVKGRILDVAVDLRVGSPTFAKWHAQELTDENQHQVFIPTGFGHGFLALSEVAEVEYKCSGYYNKSAERVIAWNDRQIGIEWPEKAPIISVRDSQGIDLADYLRRPAFVLRKAA